MMRVFLKEIFYIETITSSYGGIKNISRDSLIERLLFRSHWFANF